MSLIKPSLILSFTVLFLGFLITPQIVHADVIGGLLDQCNGVSSPCGWNLHCPGQQLFGQILFGVAQKCRPETDFEKCGDMGICAGRSDGRDKCVTIDNTAGNKGFLTAAICSNQKYFAQKDKGTEITDQCITTKNCGQNQQCIRVTAWDQEWIGVSEFVTSKRCVPLSYLPNNFVENDTTGSCGTNQSCGANESCVENTFVGAKLKSVGISIPGNLAPSSFVCYAKTNIENQNCGTVPSECTLKSGKKGYCMNVYIADGNLAPQCIDAETLPGGPNSASDITCDKDADCVKHIGADNFCLINPATKKKQCFAQSIIYSDMKNPSSDACNTTTVNPVCEKSGKPSICTPYPEKASVAVCIKYEKDGAALGGGGGTTDATPTHLKPVVAAQTYQMFAPKIQVDIPGLKFDGSITAEDGSYQIKNYSIPYLATYINAVYKYALGLGVLIAIIFIMFAGFKWMSSFGNAKAIGEARSMIGNAVMGLGLLFGVYSVLYLINPDLSKLKAIQILAPEQEIFWDNSPSGYDQVTDGQNEMGVSATIEPGKLPSFKQCDEKWGQVPYLGPNNSQIMCESSKKVDTICGSGCGITSLAAVLVYHGYAVDPPAVANWAASLGAHTSCSSGTNAQSVCKNISAKFPNLTCKGVNSKDPGPIAQYVRAGKPLIFSCKDCVGYKKDGTEKSPHYKAHFMVITGVSADGKKFSVEDVARKDGIVTILDTEFTRGAIASAYVLEKK